MMQTIQYNTKTQKIKIKQQKVIHNIWFLIIFFYILNTENKWLLIECTRFRLGFKTFKIIKKENYKNTKDLRHMHTFTFKL